MLTLIIRLILIVIGCFAGAMLGDIPKAHADVITCPYPGVGSLTQVSVIANGQGFYCDDPIEINGAHMHCQQGSGGVGFQGGFSNPVTIGGVPAGTNSGGFGNFQISASHWDCGWVCPPRPGDPDFMWATVGPPAAQPNPPGAWKDRLKPVACTPYERGGPVDTNSLPPAGLNPFYEGEPSPPVAEGLPENPNPTGGCDSVRPDGVNPTCPNPVQTGG